MTLRIVQKRMVVTKATLAPLLGIAAVYAIVLIALGGTGQKGKREQTELEAYVLEPIESVSARQMALVGAYRSSMLWGGQGKVTTGTSVDGRRTVPGLHTDCVPGVLHSDCSPQQEDGAWSTDAERFLDSRTGGAHSKSMAGIQADIDAGYAARDKFLSDCLKDSRLCTGRRTDSRFLHNPLLHRPASHHYFRPVPSLYLLLDFHSSAFPAVHLPAFAIFLTIRHGVTSARRAAPVQQCCTDVRQLR
jgi:hypothetical protein